MLNDDNAIEMSARVMELVSNYPQVSVMVVDDIVVTNIFSIAIYRKHCHHRLWSQIRISIMKSTLPIPIQEDNSHHPTYIIACKDYVTCLPGDLDGAIEVLERLIREHLLTNTELRAITEIDTYKKEVDWAKETADTLTELKELLKIVPMIESDYIDDKTIITATYQSDLHEIEVYARSDKQNLYYVKSTLGIDIADTKQTDLDLVLTTDGLTREQLFKYITLQLKMKQIADVMK